MLRVEFVKLIRMRLALWLVVATIGLTLIRGLVFPPVPGLPWSGLWSSGLVSASLTILTAVTVGQEFSSGTFRVLVGRGVARWKLLMVQWAALILVGGALLVGIEVLAVLIAIRSELHPAELGRAWLALWPLVSLVMLSAVLARSGGLPMVLGVLLLAVETLYAIIIGPMAQMAEMFENPSVLQPFTEGWIAALYQHSVSFNAANWTYLAEWQRAPVTFGLIILSTPRTAVRSAIILAAYAIAGLVLSLVVAQRRELGESVVTESSLARRIRRGRQAQKSSSTLRRLPRWTGRGPVVVRLVYTHLWHLRKTSLFKISAAAGLLFPLTLVLITRLVDDPRMLFQPQVAGAVPVIVSACIFPIPPLAVVIACLAVGNEITLGTRRAFLARGVTRSQAITSESISLVGLIGALLTWLMGACVIISAAVGATLPPDAVILAVGVGMLAAAVYAGIVQLGAAAVQSGLGAVLVGLGFLAADWVAFFAPTATTNPGPIINVVPYTVMAMVYSLVSGQPTLTLPSAPAAAPSAIAVGLLTGLALGAHGLAILVARRRDG